jgi:hypothetical protein
MRIREPAFRDSENVRDPARYACPVETRNPPVLTPDDVVGMVAAILLTGASIALWLGWL